MKLSRAITSLYSAQNLLFTHAICSLVIDRFDFSEARVLKRDSQEKEKEKETTGDTPGERHIQKNHRQNVTSNEATTMGRSVSGPWSISLKGPQTRCFMGRSNVQYYSCYLSSLRMYVARQSETLVQKCHPHAASIKDFYGSVACHQVYGPTSCMQVEIVVCI